MRNRLGTALALSLLLLPASAGAQAPATIQPGDAVNDVCTLGWLFDGSDGWRYFSTAAHCFELGTEVSTGGAPLGRVAFRGDPIDAPTDVALIRVHESVAPRVAGALRGHPEIPSGTIAASEAASGDELQISGWGTGFDTSESTREQRKGVFYSGDLWQWEGLAPLSGGDSGGPIAHVPTGAALGLNKGHRCTSTSTLACGQGGPSVGAIHRLAQGAGLQLTLRLAGQPAPPRPAPAPSPGPAEQQPAPAEPRPPAKKPSAKAACRKKARKIKNKRKRKAALKRCAKKR